MVQAARELAVLLGTAIRDQRVLAVIAAVPRERFIPASLRERAYENVALPIDCEQTISQPLVVGRMLELLELTGSEHVLDVGTGSGYHAALLARLARRVDTIERHARLSQLARGVLTELGIANVELHIGDGTAGLPDRAPFDAINVAAAIDPSVPQALLDQLAPAGRLVAPVRFGRGDAQRLVLLRREAGGIRQVVLEPVRFVPLVSGEAQPPPGEGPAPAPSGERPVPPPPGEGPAPPPPAEGAPAPPPPAGAGG